MMLIMGSIDDDKKMMNKNRERENRELRFEGEGGVTLQLKRRKGG